MRRLQGKRRSSQHVPTTVVNSVAADEASSVSSESAASASANWPPRDRSPESRNPPGKLFSLSTLFSLMSGISDPIADLLARMRNAQSARKDACRIPHSRLKQQLCELLKREDWIADVAVEGEVPSKEIVVTFIPEKKLTLERVSKPGRRTYTKAADIKSVLRGFGIAVLTTSKGLLTDKQAREQKVGGEILCTVS